MQSRAHVSALAFWQTQAYWLHTEASLEALVPWNFSPGFEACTKALGSSCHHYYGTALSFHHQLTFVSFTLILEYWCFGPDSTQPKKILYNTVSDTSKPSEELSIEGVACLTLQPKFHLCVSCTNFIFSFRAVTGAGHPAVHIPIVGPVGLHTAEPSHRVSPKQMVQMEVKDIHNVIKKTHMMRSTCCWMMMRQEQWIQEEVQTGRGSKKNNHLLGR